MVVWLVGLIVVAVAVGMAAWLVAWLDCAGCSDGVGLGCGGRPMVRPSCRRVANAGVGPWRAVSGCGFGSRSG